jgi:methylmalonyl-CoA carboxyltransferase large subunit
MSKLALEKLAAVVEELQKQVASLSERLAKLEPPFAAETKAHVITGPGVPAAATLPAEAVTRGQHQEIPPEILIAISAAVAAYLGERAHVRAVRLISTSRWSQEGRVSIQASHHLTRS